MKKALLTLLVCALCVAVIAGLSWAQCPEDPRDSGECDTLNVICLDCAKATAGPWTVRFPLLVSHDQITSDDSLAGFAIPLKISHTNPSAFCSVNTYWNQLAMGWYFPTFGRSIYRHMFATDYPTPSADTLYPNRFAQIEGDFSGRGWDLTILDLKDSPPESTHFWLTVVPTGQADQRWWEGNRVLLATITMKVQDTMHVCIDSTFWPPATSLTYGRSDASTYVPRHNMPACFWVGPAEFSVAAEPDTQVVVAGNSAQYNVTVTSINGFSGSVTLSATNLPPNSSVGFAPNPVTPTGTSVMTVTTGVTTSGGLYTITVNGTQSGKAPPHSTQVVLKVTTPEAVTVTAPNGGEQWCAGSGHNITWSSSGMDSVKIEYSTNGGTGWTTVTPQYQAAGGSYPWTVPGTPSSNCLVRICDSKDGTPCDQSNAAFTISDIPAAPSGCVASDDLCDKVRVCWTDNSNNETRFLIYRNSVLRDSVAANVLCYDDLTATPGTTYAYCVSARNQCGVSGQSCDNGMRKPAPAAPSNCIASDDLCDNVHVSWTDNSTDETKFYIYRNAAKLDSVAADVQVYDDATASPGTTYEYCVKAYNPCGESGQSCDNGTRKAPPLAPTACAASDHVCDKVHLTWTDNSSSETKFYIYRNAALLDSVGANVTTYDDLTAAPGVTYSYCVSARNECGASGQSCDNGVMPVQSVALTVPNGGESWAVGTAHNVTWTHECMDSVKIDYSTDAGSNWANIVPQIAAAPGSYSWTIPNAPSDECLVRICDSHDGTPCDTSNQLFSIVVKDFAIDVTPDTLRIMRTTAGDSFTVMLTSIEGFNSPCTLTVSGLPSGVTGVFHPATVVPSGTARLVMSANGTVPFGWYPLTVTAAQMAGGKTLAHSQDVTLFVVLPSWGFALEADPDSQDVVIPNPVYYDITMLPDVGYAAPCTLSVLSGLPSGATAAFSDTVIFPNETSTLTITTTGATPANRYDITVKGVASPKEEETIRMVLVTLVVQDFAFDASPDTQYVTQGQAAGFDLDFESLFGFSDPCTLMVTGLPNPPNNAVFDPPELIPSGSATLTVYTDANTDTGWYNLTVTAQSKPSGKPEALEHHVHVFLKVNEASGVDDWADDFSRPQGFALFQNQPNPFNPETRISYFLPVASQVDLSIYNVLGQKVRTLFQDYQDAGTHTLMWDGRSDDGMQLSSGIYFYRMQAGSFQETKKMTLMK